jgi:hypothetical protein
MTTQYTDVMVDLETVGTAPGSGIISIGAVAFTQGTPQDEWLAFEVPVISLASNAAAGLRRDQATCDWWADQEPEARMVYDAAQEGGAHLAWALTEFARFFPSGARLWGNGADFDNVLLRCAFVAVGLEAPWRYSASRCFRTLKSQFTAVASPEFQGVKHNALADALHQTRWLQNIVAYTHEVEQFALNSAIRAGVLACGCAGWCKGHDRAKLSGGA